MKRHASVAVTVASLIALGLMYVGSYLFVVRPARPVRRTSSLFGPGGQLAVRHGLIRYTDNESVNSACEVFYWPMEKLWPPRDAEPWWY